MKKIISLLLTCSLLMFGTGFVSLATAQTETIATIEAAKELAKNAGGIFVEGEKTLALTGNQVALPVIEEKTGKILGHIVADQDSLVSALNAAGHSEVASTIAAGKAGAAAGTAAGTAVGAGFLGGTVGMAALGAAAIAGVALAVSSGGSDGSTAHH